jgi:hypothetical protein
MIKSGQACRLRKRNAKQILVGESQKERYHSEDQVEGGCITLRLILREIGLGCILRIGLAQDRNQWRALVTVVMNRQIP